jgi:hypothetical protein
MERLLFRSMPRCFGIRHVEATLSRKPPVQLEPVTEHFHGGLGLGLDHLPQRPGSRRNRPHGALPVQQLLQECLAHAEQGPESILRAETATVGPQCFLSKIERISLHA